MIVPSFVAKVSRAKKHLIDLETAIDEFARTKPYTVTERIEGKKKRKIRRMTFTADPANTDIPIIAADAIYNLRSSLDHLMSSLVPSNQRTSAIFPIYFEGVWEPSLPGENKQRIKERARWSSDTKALSEPVVAILKELQPADRSWQQIGGVDLLQWLNQLSNRDRHQKLPVFARGLRDLRVKFTLADGAREDQAPIESVPVFENNADLKGIPNDAVDVEIEGTPVIAIRIEDLDGYLPIPKMFWNVLTRVETEVIMRLMPFVRT
jgi:hypothetical protein